MKCSGNLHQATRFKENKADACGSFVLRGLVPPFVLRRRAAPSRRTVSAATCPSRRRCAPPQDERRVRAFSGRSAIYIKQSAVSHLFDPGIFHHGLYTMFHKFHPTLKIITAPHPHSHKFWQARSSC